jgi:hypothetical protein
MESAFWYTEDHGRNLTGESTFYIEKQITKLSAATVMRPISGTPLRPLVLAFTADRDGDTLPLSSPAQ